MAKRFWQLLAAASPGNRLKKFFLRRSGARIGKHVRIRRGSYIFASEIAIDDGEGLMDFGRVRNLTRA